MPFLHQFKTTRTPSALVVAALLFVSFSASGCNFWRNFSSYFNTLYLAQQHLEIYESEMQRPAAAPTGAQAATTRRWLDEEYESRIIAQKNGVVVKITPSFVRQKQGAIARGSANTVHLDSAIILGSKVLAKKDVKYIEDALYIIGKAQFYKNDYSGAKRKFLELLSRFPDTKYGSEVHTFLGRSMLANNELDTAYGALQTALRISEASGEEEEIAAVHQAHAEYLYAKDADTLVAISDALAKAEANLDEHEAAKVAYELGIIYYLDGRWADAEAAFSRAAKEGDDNFFVGEAKIAKGLALRRLERFEESKKELEDVATRAIYSVSHPAARFELARTEEAIARSMVKGNVKREDFYVAHFPRAKAAYYTVDTMFRTVSQAVVSRSRFQQAELYREMAMYDSAARYALPLIGTKDFSTPTYNEYVGEKMRSLARFSQWKRELRSTDSALENLRAPRTGVSEVARSEAANRTRAIQEVLGDRYRPDEAPVLSNEDSVKVEAKVRELSKPKLAGVIRDTSKYIDSLNLRRANAYYELGRAFEQFGEIPESRVNYHEALGFRYIVMDTAKEAFQAQVYYAWLQLEHREKNFAVRDSILEILAKRYGQTIYAEQAMHLFGKEQDPNSPSEIAYREAYQRLKRDGVESAKPQLLTVRNNFKNEDAAPRSLYAIGLTYEDMTRYDSAVVYYSQILTDYPYSQYAELLRPRLAQSAIVRPRRQTARRVDPQEVQSREQKQQEELDREREARQKELEEQQNQTPQPFGTPPDSTPEADPPEPGTTVPMDVPSSPFEQPNGK